ncbi:hypothetical protein BN946_scf184970.g121 [Trametes cinnabarina]|uniref:SWIRM domain-containing protein n=1 Tax=Pycnoporus cinnabarinus TaxID=5643 RepID=A0A060SJ84_PYCCI|nr:hypothetical protein BN946_scf184970.g121 [Trametes cinnabarina]
MTRLSTAKRQKILDLYHPVNGEPLSLSEIAGHVHCDRSTVRQVLQQVSSSGQLNYDIRPKGRPRILSKQDLQELQLALDRGSVLDATDAQWEITPHASTRTVCRRLAEIGLPGWVRQRKPLLKKSNLAQRKVWMRDVKDWGVKEWWLVVFSNESQFDLFPTSGRQWCPRRKGEAHYPRNTIPCVPAKGGKVTVWGCITSRGVGHLHQIIGTMDAKMYRDILEESLLGTLYDHHLSPRTIIFQHDNDPKHKSHLVQEWLEKQNILVLPWPSSSPDFNIIENVWAHIKKRLERY